MVKQKQKTIYIYKIYFPTNRKCYVGQSVNLNRPKNHIKSKWLIGNAMRKYDNWQVSILHKTKSKAKANKLEIAAIVTYNCIRPNGYNLKPGGEGGNIFSGKTEEEMKQITEKTNETKIRNGTTGKGKKHSAETVIKNYLTRKGIKYTKSTAIKWLRERLRILQKRSPHTQRAIKHSISLIAKYEKWLKELNKS